MAEKPTSMPTVFGGLNRIDPATLSSDQKDRLRVAAVRLAHAVSPRMLLRAAGRAVEDDGSLSSEGATLAALAIDTTYPEWGGLVGRVVSELGIYDGANAQPIEELLDGFERGRPF
jgi:hypothetical protein